MRGATGHAVHRVGRDHCLAPSRTADAPAGGARYGHMFPDLPSLICDIPALHAAGEPGGVCDAAAAQEVPDGGGDDAAGAAGWPFFGQVIAHDITADRSPIGPHADLAALRNARSPKLNLEIVYGQGPVGAPYLYDLHDPPKLLTGAQGLDLPRNSQGIALIGDPRNDVHIFAAHLQLALLHSHNGLVDRLRADGEPEAELFDAARRTLTRHYQWIIVHDFLPRLVGTQLVGDVIAHGGRFFSPPPGEAYVPLEFADAAYRYGHSQIRHTYQLQPGGPALPLFPDLAGLGPITPEHRVDLGQLFDLPGHAPAQRAKRMDPAKSPETSMSTPTARSRCATCYGGRPPACRPGKPSPPPWGSRRSPPARSAQAGPRGPRYGSTSSKKPRFTAPGISSARSAAASSPRYSSGCSVPTPTPT